MKEDFKKALSAKVDPEALEWDDVKNEAIREENAPFALEKDFPDAPVKPKEAIIKTVLNGSVEDGTYDEAFLERYIESEGQSVASEALKQAMVLAVKENRGEAIIGRTEKAINKYIENQQNLYAEIAKEAVFSELERKNFLGTYGDEFIKEGKNFSDTMDRLNDVQAHPKDFPAGVLEQAEREYDKAMNAVRLKEEEVYRVYGIGRAYETALGFKKRFEKYKGDAYDKAVNQGVLRYMGNRMKKYFRDSGIIDSEVAPDRTLSDLQEIKRAFQIPESEILPHVRMSMANRILLAPSQWLSVNWIIKEIDMFKLFAGCSDQDCMDILDTVKTNLPKRQGLEREMGIINDAVLVLQARQLDV